jgi:hypothetical protein
MGTHAASRYDGQIHDFSIKVRELGYKEGDFAVRCLQWPATAKPVAAMSDLIIVKRLSAEVEIAYAADTDGKWLLSFVDDLNNGVFDALEQSIYPLSVVKSELESG